MAIKFYLDLLFVPLLSFWALQASYAAETQSQNSVLIISVDGLRPDVLLRSNAPVIRKLISEGSFSFYAQTTDLAITLPSHVSMLTGVSPTTHTVNWNDDRARQNKFSLPVPTIFELAKHAGFATGVVAGKAKFSLLATGAGVDFAFIPDQLVMASDAEVAGQAVSLLAAHPIQLLFLHLPNVDSVGHAQGWGSQAQLAAVSLADSSIAKILDAFFKNNRARKVYVVLSSDHGGERKTHGAENAASHFIPLILWGPDIRHNFDLTLQENQIHIEDIFSTTCRLLSLSCPQGILGKSIEAAFQ